MRKLLFCLTTIVSALLYSYATLQYSREFCILCLIVFLTDAILIIKEDIKNINLFNFNLLFFFTFFLCTYVYPVFLIGEKSVIGLLIESKLNTYNTVNRCVSLSTFAISVYSLAYSVFRKRIKFKNTPTDINILNLMYPQTKLLLIAISFAVLLVLGRYLTDEYFSNEVDAPYLLQLFYYIFPMYMVCSVFYFYQRTGKQHLLKNVITDNKFICLIISTIVILFLLIGDRFPVIFILLAVISTISLFIKRIKLRHLIIGSLIGALLMFGMRVTRQGGDSLFKGGVSKFVVATESSFMEILSPWDIFADLVGINIELNTGMDYVDKAGYLYPMENLISHLSSPIPFLPTMLLRQFFGIERPQDVASGVNIGEYINYTAGNHCVIDIYMPYGVVGIVIVFFLFGLLVAKITNGLNNSLYCKFFYIYLMSFSIFLVRNSLTNVYRVLILSLIIYYFMTLFSKKEKILISKLSHQI